MAPAIRDHAPHGGLLLSAQVVGESPLVCGHLRYVEHKTPTPDARVVTCSNICHQCYIPNRCHHIQYSRRTSTGPFLHPSRLSTARWAGDTAGTQDPYRATPRPSPLQVGPVSNRRIIANARTLAYGANVVERD